MAYITLTEFKTYLGVENSFDDDLITDIISSAETLMENLTETVFDVSSVSTRYFDFDTYNNRELFFDTWLATDTDVVVTNGDGLVIPSTEYVFMDRNRPPFMGLKLKRYSNSYFTYEDTPEEAISVEGYWGWSQTVPDDIKQAMKRLTAYLYRQKDAQVFDATSFNELGRIVELQPQIPRDIIAIIERYRPMIG